MVEGGQAAGGQGLEKVVDVGWRGGEAEEPEQSEGLEVNAEEAMEEGGEGNEVVADPVPGLGGGGCPARVSKGADGDGVTELLESDGEVVEAEVGACRVAESGEEGDFQAGRGARVIEAWMGRRCRGDGRWEMGDGE